MLAHFITSASAIYMTYPNRINVPPARNSPDNCENLTPRWGSYEENNRHHNYDLVFIFGQVKVIPIYPLFCYPHFTTPQIHCLYVWTRLYSRT